MDNRVCVNTRCIKRRLKGVRRYTKEVLKRIPNSVRKVYPRHLKGQILGQIWVQTYLPAHVKGNLLWSPTGIGPIIKKNQVLTIHDISPIDHPEWFTRRYSTWIRTVLPILIRRCRKIIAVSEYTKKRILSVSNIETNKIDVVYNGLSSRFSPQTEREEKRVRKQLGLPSKNYLLSLGTISPRKNTKRLLEAWRQVQRDVGKDYWLVMVGEKGPAQGTMDLKVPDRVLFTGYVKDENLPPLYSGAKAFLYPSLYEGFGLPPLESMASGTPPIVGDRTSLPEVVEDGGLFVNPLKVESIAEGILKIVRNETLSRRLREKGLQRAKQFAWEKTARETWKTLRKTARSDYRS